MFSKTEQSGHDLLLSVNNKIMQLLLNGGNTLNHRTTAGGFLINTSDLMISYPDGRIFWSLFKNEKSV